MKETATVAPRRPGLRSSTAKYAEIIYASEENKDEESNGSKHTRSWKDTSRVTDFSLLHVRSKGTITQEEMTNGQFDVGAVEVVLIMEVKRIQDEIDVLPRLDSAKDALLTQASYVFSCNPKQSSIVAVAVAGNYYTYTILRNNLDKLSPARSEMHDSAWIPPQDTVRPIIRRKWSDIIAIDETDRSDGDWKAIKKDLLEKAERAEKAEKAERAKKAKKARKAE